MTMRERNHHERQTPSVATAPGGANPLLTRAAEVQARGADAIERALSTDSRAFLAANKQEGGQ